MSDSLTRRGFTQAAIAGMAALCVPALGRAQDSIQVRPRWQWLSHPERLMVRLHISNDGSSGVQLVANAITVEGRLRRGDEEKLVILGRQHQIRSRVWRPRARLIAIPAGQEVHYGTFYASWPEGWPTGVAELRLRASGVERQQSAEEPRGFRILERMTGRVRVTRPA